MTQKEIAFWFVLIVTLPFVIIYASVVKEQECVSGKVEVCIYNSPYTNQPEGGRRICNKNGWWDDCHPLCK